MRKYLILAFVCFAAFLVSAGCIQTSSREDGVQDERLAPDENYPELHTAAAEVSDVSEKASATPVEVPLPPEEGFGAEDEGANPYYPLNENVSGIDASVAPEDMEKAVISPLDAEETALLENITLGAE
jgi:hypothetical protein